MAELLKFTNVSKEYTKGNKALEDINFTINKGEFISIIGKSGAGKSTFLRCINRMITPTEGNIVFKDKDITNISKKDLKVVRREIGMIFQHYNLVERSSVLSNVLHGRLGYTSDIKGMFGIFSNEDKLLAYNTLVDVGLEDQIYKRGDQLSGGQKQRVGIARALVQNPELMLADEPIASLDPFSSKVIMDYLKKINKEKGITIIANLHQVDVAINYSTRIIGLSKGKLVFDGTPEELTVDAINKIYGTEAEDLIINLEVTRKIKEDGIKEQIYA